MSVWCNKPARFHISRNEQQSQMMLSILMRLEHGRKKKRTTKCLIVLIKPVGYISEKTLDLANGDDLFGWIHKENTQQQAKKEKKKEKKKCPRWELQPKPFAYQEVFAKALMLQKCQLWPGWKTRFKLKFDQKRIFFWISLLRLPPRFCTAN